MKPLKLGIASILFSVATFAFGSGWTTSTAYSGSSTMILDGTTTTTTWSTSTTPVGLKQNVKPNHSCSVSESGTITITYTWSGTDPTPPYVWIWANPTATGQGTTCTADDGNGDAATGSTSTTETSHAPNASGKLIKKTGSTFTLSYSVSASGSASVPVGGSLTTVSAAVGATSSVHATPYNFTNVAGAAEPNGNISLAYTWLSTSGNLNDIPTTVSIHEYVSFSGPGTYDPVGGTYQPTNPPIATSYPNPTIEPLNASEGGVIDTHYAPSFATPYSTISYTGNQKFYYDDADTGETLVILFGPISIVRSITFTSAYYYGCSALGISSSLLLPNQ